MGEAFATCAMVVSRIAAGSVAAAAREHGGGQRVTGAGPAMQALRHSLPTDTIVRASEWRRGVSSKPGLVYRNHAHLLAFGLEVVGNVIHAVGPFARRQPEFDEAEARTQGHEAR